MEDDHVAKRDLSGAVDFPRLELYAGGDTALVEEVLALFQEQADLWLRLLEGGGGGGFRDAAHALKGSALGLCADGLADAEWARHCQLWLYRGAWQEWGPDLIEMAVPISPA